MSVSSRCVNTDEVQYRARESFQPIRAGDEASRADLNQDILEVRTHSNTLTPSAKSCSEVYNHTSEPSV